MNFHRVIGCVIALSLAACADDTTDAALSDCVVGLWVRSERACECATGETPECSETSCREYGTAWSIRADGTSREFILRFASGPSTTSAPGELLPGEWAIVEPDQLDRIHGGLSSVGALTCDDARLTWRGIEFTRADPRLSAAIEPYVAEGERWTAMAY